MIKKISILLCCFVLAGLLGGCWSRREINEVAIVLGAGVDWTEGDHIRLTVQMAIPGAFAAGGEGGNKGKEASSLVVSAEGATIEEAERYLAMKVPRDIYWGHSIVLVIGEQMAKKGAQMVTDFFERDRQPRETMWIMVAKGEAKDFLETYSDLQKTSAQAVGFLTRKRTGYPVQLREFAEMLASKEIQPAVTGVEVKEAGVAQGPGQEGRSPSHKQVVISGVGIFKEDKLVGWLDDHETRGLMWLKGEPMDGVITVPSPNEPDKKVSIRIRRGKTGIEAESGGEYPRFNVKIKVEGDMVEQQSRENLAKPEMIKALESEMADEIKKRTTAALRKARDEYGVDVFGFGHAFHHRFKKDWRELEDRWDEVFRRAEINITVEAYVREIGLLTRRLGTPEE